MNAGLPGLQLPHQFATDREQPEMKRRISMIAAGLVLCAASGGVQAETAAESITVSDAYARAVPPGQPNSAAFMTLSNRSAADHALVEVRSDVAQVVELHTHRMKDGMMQMRRVAQIDVPANGETRLRPGGLHVMLIGLQRDLQPGEAVSLQFEFEDGSLLEHSAPVRKLQMKMMEHGGKMMH